MTCELCGCSHWDRYYRLAMPCIHGGGLDFPEVTVCHGCAANVGQFVQWLVNTHIEHHEDMERRRNN